MDIHDIEIEYDALPMTAFLGRPYRTFLDTAVFFDDRYTFLSLLKRCTLLWAALGATDDIEEGANQPQNALYLSENRRKPGSCRIIKSCFLDELFYSKNQFQIL